MTFNLLNNSPCLEVDGKEWTKSSKIGTLYVVGNHIIISNDGENVDKKPEFFHLSLDMKYLENFILSKCIPDQISVQQNFKPPTYNFKVNQLRNDFHSIKPIGKGGFGRVYSAISNIDWQMYAIKKIKNCSKFNKKEIADTLKEFRILAKLNHCNIVRYHTTWFEQISNAVWNNHVEDIYHSSEPVSISNKISASSSSINNSSSLSKSFNASIMSNLTNSESESNKSEILDVDSFSTENQESQDSIVFACSSNSISGRNSTDSINSKNEHQGIIDLYKGSKSSVNKFDFVLYIQMEFCHLNLQDWLEIRNKQPGVLHDLDMKNVRCLARQLLKGVEYIHSNKIIHRDIKPANIFLTIHPTNHLQLKIGDFGLSKLF